MERNFTGEIVNYYNKIYGIRSITPLLLNVLSTARKEYRKAFQKYLDENSTEKVKENDTITYTLPPQAGIQVIKQSTRLRHFDLACSITPESFLVTIIGQYDAYIGRLISLLLTQKPEILNASDKKLSISEIISSPSLEDVKETIIEKEIESVIRENHLEQIKWFERKLGIPLTNEQVLISKFIELTERRNLFTHTDGIISNQYIKVCKENLVQLPETIKVGEKITADNKYFISSCDCLLELGIKLAQVIWRKIKPEEIELADTNLIQISYDMIKSKEYDLALQLLIFGTETIKKHDKEESKLYLIINKAQAYKWKGNNDKCKEIIAEIDWTAKSNKYLLVKAVLEDNFTEAEKFMRLIGSDGEMGVPQYVDWPILKEFRLSEEFLKAYKDIFKEEYKFIEREQE